MRVETDEDGSFLQLTLMNEDVGEDHVPELLEVINIMNGIQDQVRFFITSATAPSSPSESSSLKDASQRKFRRWCLNATTA